MYLQRIMIISCLRLTFVYNATFYESDKLISQHSE